MKTTALFSLFSCEQHNQYGDSVKHGDIDGKAMEQLKSMDTCHLAASGADSLPGHDVTDSHSARENTHHSKKVWEGPQKSTVVLLTGRKRFDFSLRSSIHTLKPKPRIYVWIINVCREDFLLKLLCGFISQILSRGWRCGISCRWTKTPLISSVFVPPPRSLTPCLLSSDLCSETFSGV